MRTPKFGGAMGCVLLAALLSSMGAHAAVTDTKKPSKQQPVSAVADTQASARRQGAVNVSGINWACRGTHCSASAMPSAVAAPVAVCQGLAREVGAIRSFKVVNRPLNGNELQQCNSVVPAVAAALPSMKTPQGAGLPPAAPIPGVALPPMQSRSQPGKAAKAPITGFATPSPLMSDLAKKPSATNKVNRKTSPYPENWIEPDLRADKSPAFGDMKNALRKNDQTAMPSAKRPSATPQAPMKSGGGFVPQVAMTPTTPDPAKKPSGAKGSMQTTAQGDGKASSPPPQPPRPAGPFSPVTVRTPPLTLTGIGVAEISYRFTPVAVRTPKLTLTGIGVAEISYRFTPVAVRTPRLTLTGTGRSE